MPIKSNKVQDTPSSNKSQVLIINTLKRLLFLYEKETNNLSMHRKNTAARDLHSFPEVTIPYKKKQITVLIATKRGLSIQ